MNALVSLDSILEPAQALVALTLFGSGQVETILTAIEKDVRGELYDIETEGGRERIKSVAYKIARSKMTLDEIGKEHVAEIKAQSGKIDAERRALRDRLDALKDEVRGPLTAWEAAETARIAEHEALLVSIVTSHEFTYLPQAETIRNQIASIERFRAREWDEFLDRAYSAITEAVARLDGMAKTAEQAEADAAELAELRRLKADRDAADSIAAEAALEAERVRIFNANRERLEAEAAEKQKAHEIAQAEQAARDREAAIARAVEQERQRVAAQKATQDAAERKRQENRRRRQKVHKEIADFLMVAGLSDVAAGAVVEAVVAGKIPHVSINY